MTTTAFMTDKYEITMLQSALRSGLAGQKAVFELFARKLPGDRRYGVVAGVERAISAVENFRFNRKQIKALQKDPAITAETIDYLKKFKFSGTVTGYHEGDLYFPYSPILTVEGTFGECVLLETVLLSIMNYDSAVASAASRMVQAGQGMSIIEMGSRRAHDEAAVDAARAAYIAGFAGTSNLQAGLEYGIPTMGTSAHAFSLAFKDERDAFREQVAALGASTTLLVDTYDIEQGIRNAIEVAGTELGAIRIDSGDLVEETVKARALLDELGATHTKIILSSDIDEYKISELLDNDAPVDGVGAGTRVVTGSGHPTAGMVYKLVAIEDPATGKMRPVAKKASGKGSMGGRKYAWRKMDNHGKAIREVVVAREDDHFKAQYTSAPDRRATQHVFIDNGRTVFKPDTEAARAFHRFAISELRPMDLRIEAGTPAIATEH